ncbi:MAG TPA: TonB-dependent receptor [Caulobacteraceae bacterium]|nr:TonB-dependent receptor [Caulobacteraceae bacterium]
MNRRALGFTVSIAALGAAFAAVPAAKAADAAASGAAQASEATVQAVTITAERRSVNLQTAPVVASVISGAQLTTEGIQTVDDLQFHTPSLTITDFGQGNLFNIRGIGKDLTNIQTPSGVVTYWDGVASFPGFFQDEPYYDVSNVEVLRGPQGTFAGQNATGGAVFIVTNDPKLNSLGGDILAQYGNYNDRLLQGYWNIPLGDTVAVRFAFNGEQRHSFYHVAGPWTAPFGGAPGRLLEGSFRIGLLWTPTDALRFVLKDDYSYIDHGGSVADPVVNPANPAELNPADPFHVTNNAPNYGTDKFNRLSLNASYTLPDGIVLRSISGYQYGITNQSIDLDGTDLFPFTFSDYGQEQVYSEELNLVSPDRGPLRWVGGLYYQSDTVNLPAVGGFDIGAPPGIFDINIAYHTPKITEAAFGQVSYDFTRAWQVEVGARYTHSTFTLDDDNFVDNQPAAGLVLHARTNDDAVTGKVALNFRPDDANTLYAFVAEGHKQNGINTDPATVFGPEEVTDFEAGWKPVFFDRHVYAQLDAYYSMYRHFQLQFTQSSQTNLIQNVSGMTTIYGVEAEAQARFGALSFDAGGSYEHSRLGSDLIIDPTLGSPVQLGGRALPLAPEWTFNFGASYDIELPNGAILTPHVDYSYIAGQWATPFQRFGEYLGPRNLVNAELAYQQDKWRLALFATNAFNLRYIAAVNVGLPFELRYAGAPAQYGVRLERRF